jgi:hypothetical protein
MTHRMRASYAQSIVAELVQGPRGHEVMTAIAPEAARINALVGVTLMPADDIDAVFRIVIEKFGEDLVVQASRHHMARLRDSPLMRSLIDAVLRISGLTPHAIFKVAPRARDSVVSGVGTLAAVRLGDRQARLELRGFPPHSVALHVVHLRGSWLGILDQCGVTGTVTATMVDASRGDVDFDIDWR